MLYSGEFSYNMRCELFHQIITFSLLLYIYNINYCLLIQVAANWFVKIILLSLLYTISNVALARHLFKSINFTFSQKSSYQTTLKLLKAFFG